MVFFRLGLGVVTGITIPLVVHHNVYMVIANSFLRPHLKFRVEQSKLTKDHAIQAEALDSYLKDVIGSFFLFFIAIGPVIYTTHFKKAQLEKEEKELDDKYANMLVQIRDAQEQQMAEQMKMLQ